MNKLTLTFLALAASLVMSAQASADHLSYPNGLPFLAIESDFQHVRDDIADLSSDVSDLQDDVTMIKDDVADIESDVSDLQGDVSTIQSDVEALTEVLIVQVALDIEYCATIGVQCAAFSSDPADDGNNNPVHLLASVSRGGVAVGGLGEGDFAFAGSFVPPGGTAASLCDSTDCGGSNFGAGAGGVYSMFIVTADLSDWDNGVYGGSLSVSDPAGGSGLALVTFAIPEAP